MDPTPENVAILRAAMREYAFGDDLDAEWAHDRQEQLYFAGLALIDPEPDTDDEEA